MKDFSSLLIPAASQAASRWMDYTNRKNAHLRQSCSGFSDAFAGYYDADFLQQAGFVVRHDIPMPRLPGTRALGLEKFLTMQAAGITYKNTYYVHPKHMAELRLHFHELVHVVQWQLLGSHQFIKRYINEIQQYGYRNAPLEIMAYDLDSHFSQGRKPINIHEYVEKTL